MIKGVTIDNFPSLGVDDKVELPPLMPALGIPVVGRVKRRTDDTVIFVVTLAGVTLGTWSCKLEGGNFKWLT